MRKLGGGNKAEAGRGKLGWGSFVLGSIWEASGKHQGSIWEAPGRHLGSIWASGIWEASGMHLDASGKHLAISFLRVATGQQIPTVQRSRSHGEQLQLDWARASCYRSRTSAVKTGTTNKKEQQIKHQHKASESKGKWLNYNEIRCRP